MISKDVIELLTDCMLCDNPAAPNWLSDKAYDITIWQLDDKQATAIAQAVFDLASALVADDGKYL